MVRSQLIDKWVGVRDHLRGLSLGVALTFDDGPDARFTPQLLELLDTLKVRATFFLVGGRASAQSQLVREIVASGHQVGTHSHTHADLAKLPLRALLEEIRIGKEIVENILSRPTLLFRPPHGYLDCRVAVAIRRYGLQVWLWSVSPDDWRPGMTAMEITRRSRLNVGDVLLLHDGLCDPVAEIAQDRTATIRAVESIVGEARARGLEFVLLGTGATVHSR